LLFPIGVLAFAPTASRSSNATEIFRELQQREDPEHPGRKARTRVSDSNMRREWDLAHHGGQEEGDLPRRWRKHPKFESSEGALAASL